MPLSEVTDVYLPLSRLLNLSVAASRDLFAVTNRFLGRDAARVPYIIGIAGSVAVGKSTIARVLQALLGRWPDHPRVDLVTTDGFLLPERGARRARPRCPQGLSRELRRARARALPRRAQGRRRRVSRAPVYSHLVYDVIEGEEIVVTSPDIVIVEGLNVLQVPPSRAGREEQFVSDFFDFSIYVDADEDDIHRWYIDRFMTLRETAFNDERSFFHHFTKLADDEALGRRRRGLARDQRGQPAREHRAHPFTRRPRAREGPRPRRPPGPPRQALSQEQRGQLAAKPAAQRGAGMEVATSSPARTPRRPNHANSAIHAASAIGVEAVGAAR